MNPVAAVLSRSIKEGKWVYIEYDNQNERRLTCFWISVRDIESSTKKLSVLLFNQEKSLEVLKGWIYFDQIRRAEIIKGTACPPQKELIAKILAHPDEYRFLEYSGINERILDYYKECYQHDRSGIIRRYHLVNGIDDELLSGRGYLLDEEKFREFVLHLKLYQKEGQRKTNQKIIKMAINILAIHSRAGLFPIVYRDLLLDVEKRELKASVQPSFNLRLSDEKEMTRFDLTHYFDGSPMQFIEEYPHNREMLTEEIAANLKKGEMIDERPYVFQMVQYVGVNLQQDYNTIMQHYLSNQLSAPLRAFFGLNEKERRRRPKSLLIATKDINLDQLRVVYNTMIRDIVYVQGPPGTGKTATILNVITSCFLNNQSALIVSNNNEAINNIQRKLESFIDQGRLVPFPFLRLGSNEKIKVSLGQLYQRLPDYKKQLETADFKTLKELENDFRQSIKPLQEAIQAIEEHNELSEQIEALQEIIKTIAAQKKADEVSKSMAIMGIRAQLDALTSSLCPQSEETTLALCRFDPEKVTHYLYLRSLKQLSKLFDKANHQLLEILSFEDEEERFQKFRNLIGKPEGLSMLTECFPFVISTNISCGKLGPAEPCFDLLIMDEASQCSNATALLSMARCKRALFVGDQNQLQPVLALNPEKNAVLLKSYDIPSAYDYRGNSILSTLLKIDTLSRFILLHEHYRCNEKIIHFSNQKYYGGELKLKSQFHNLDALKLIDVSSSKANEKNTSQEEIQAIIKEIRNSPTQDIAVITPFRKQADKIENELIKNHIDYVKTGTIHTFQGDEKTKIILSSGISKATQAASWRWLKNNQELINVATTRAKENLVLVTDTQAIEQLSQKETSDFLELVHYIQKDGSTEITGRENELFASKVKNFKYYNTRSEEEFLRTLLHIKSVEGQIKIRAKVKITDVLQLSKNDQTLFTYGNQAHFDFVVYNLLNQPLLAIEVMGTEHFSHQKVIERDRKKQAICKRHNLQLITIRNDYVRRYSFIKDTIMKALKG